MQSMIPEEYEIPSPIVEVSKILLYYKKNGVYLDRDYYSATNIPPDRHNCRRVVGCVPGHKISIGAWFGRPENEFRLNLIRKQGI